MKNVITPEERFGPGYEKLSTGAKLSWLESCSEWERQELADEAERVATEIKLQIAIVLAKCWRVRQFAIHR